MVATRSLLAVWAISLSIFVSARPPPQDLSVVLVGQQDRSPANSLSHSPSKDHGTIKFNFKASGGALNILGEEQLQRINTRIGLNGDISTLAAHLNDDDDLGLEPGTDSLIYSCGCLLATATAEQQAAARVAADDVAAAAVVQQHRLRQTLLGQRTQQLSEVLLTPGQSDPTGLTVAQVFSLSSRPDSKYKLVLDFDGSTLVGTPWNELKQLDKITTPPYDKDGDHSTFNAEELADIVAVWRAVAEDFAPFDVDITTIDPGDAALVGVGQKAIIGGASSDWFGVAGGVAFVNGFGRPDVPCFIFAQSLGSNNPKFIWEAVSHELGHTLGLLHDGVLPNPAMPAGTPYFTGQGDWAPLMGMPYYAEVTTWDAGEYPFSNNKQDDLAVIGRWLPRASAQIGANISTATLLTAAPALPDGATSAAASATGVVASRAQPGFFSFAAAAGPASIAVAVAPPFGVGEYNQANLKASAVMYDGSGAAMATLGSQTMGIPATDVDIPSSGMYYISVAGKGEGDPAAGGYSSYASLGRYTLFVTFQTGFSPPAIDCRGAWGSWNACTAACDQTATYSVTQAAAFGGSACSTADGSVRTQPCTGGACMLATDDPVMVITSINVTRGSILAPTRTNRMTPNKASSVQQHLSFCRAIVTLRTRAGGRLAKALVYGAWVGKDMARLNPVAAVPAASETFRTGQAVFRSKSWRTDQQSEQPPAQPAPVTACVFEVSSVEFPGKTLDKVNSVMTQTLQWK